MPNYSNQPPKETSGPSLPIMRTPASGKIRAIITSDDLIGTNTHFWGGHTVPCSPPDCEACLNSVPFRWHAYLTAFNPNKGLHFLFECTAAAAEVLVAYRREIGHLRGAIFEAYRWRGARNGRVMLRCERGPDLTTILPPAPNLEAILAVLWQLPKDAVQPTGDRGLGKLIDIHAPVYPLNQALAKGPNHAHHAATTHAPTNRNHRDQPPQRDESPPTSHPPRSPLQDS